MKILIIIMCFIPIGSWAQNSLPYLLKPLNPISLTSRNYSGETLARKDKLANRLQIKNVQFSSLEDSPARVWVRGKFILTLEDSVEIILTTQKKFKDEAGRVHLSARVEGDMFGRANLVATDKGVSGTIMAGGKEYNLMPLGEDLHAVYTYVESKLQADKHTKSIKALHEKVRREKAGYKKTDTPVIPLSTSTTNNFIDVLVVYTDDVAAASIDPEAVNSSHMDFTNQALEDSCANYRMRIVHQEQVNYAETGNAPMDLNCVTTPGHADCGANDLSIVPTLRATHGADLVVFVTNTSDYCGLAWVGIEPFTANYGYSNKLFLCSGATMAHEFGHNLGLGHDRYETGNDPRDNNSYFEEGHGYVDLVNKIRTIMTYPDQCDDLGVSCERIGIYSNPNIRKLGQAQGDPGFADATHKINRTFQSVVNFNSPVTDYSVDINESCVSSTESDKDVHCFIATAAYGSYLHNHVVKLRDFRDQILKKSALGNQLVDLYYEYSPPLAYYISQRPTLKKLARWAMTPIVFFIAYPSAGILSLLALFIFTLAFRKKKIVYMIPLLVSIPLQKSQGQVAQPSLFDHQITINPAALSAPFRSNYLGYTQDVIKGSADNGLTKVDVDGTRGQVHGAVMWESGGLAVKNQPQGSSDFNITVGNSPEYTDVYGQTYTQANLAISMFEATHLGFKYGQSKSTIEYQNTTTTEELEESRFGVGLRMKFGEWFFIGASADHITEKGTSHPDTKWIETSLGFGMSQRADGDSWVMEVSATRSPEILNQENSNVTSYGEKMRLGLIIEKEMTMADSMFNTMTMGAYYNTFTENEFSPYLDENQKISQMGVNLGIKTFNKSINATLSYGQEQKHFGDERTDTILSLTLMYNFSGSIFSLAGATY